MQQVGNAHVTSGVAPVQSAVRSARLPGPGGVRRAQISTGIEPIKSFLSKKAFARAKCVRPPIDDGIVPVKRLLERSKTVKFFIGAQFVVLTGPVRPFADTSKKIKLVSLERLGSGPVKELLFAVNVSAMATQ